MTFKARIKSRTFNAVDRLYYLEQHPEGKPRELIGSCLHMGPSEGYKEARKLLEKECRDPFKVSMLYVNRIIKLSPSQTEDAPALKRLLLFLVKCRKCYDERASHERAKSSYKHADHCKKASLSSAGKMIVV